MSKTLTISEVQAILESGNFDQFIGKKEGQFFEAKPPRPHDLQSDEAQNSDATIKLIIKIVGMANTEGGYIICGLREPPSTEVSSDQPQPSLATQGVIESLQLLPEAEAFTAENIKGRLRSNVLPRRLGDVVEVKWWPSSKNSEEGLCSIFVPQQLDTDKYYTMKIKRTVEGHLPGKFYGIPKRVDDQTEWLDLSNEIKLRRRLELLDVRNEIFERLQEVEDRVTETIKSSGAGSGATDRLNQLIEEVIDE
jgi:predicted HTH transcriptional regulator